CVPAGGFFSERRRVVSSFGEQKSRLKSFNFRVSPFAAGTLLSAWCLFVGAPQGRAQTPQPPPEPSAEGAATADVLGSKVSIHGYMSQAYAKTDGNEIAGITESGTADYRAAAIQVRAEITPQDSFAVQFSHERLGKTGLQAFQQDVALDW